MTSFTDLAENMVPRAKALDEYLRSAGCPPASFSEDTLIDLPPEMEETRNALVDAAQTMKRLALGARGTYWEILFAVCLNSFRLQ